MYKHRHENALHPENCNLQQAALQRCMTNTISRSTAGQQKKKRKQLFLDLENDSAADEHHTRTGYIQLASPIIATLLPANLNIRPSTEPTPMQLTVGGRPQSSHGSARAYLLPRYFFDNKLQLLGVPRFRQL